MILVGSNSSDVILDEKILLKLGYFTKILTFWVIKKAIRAWSKEWIRIVNSVVNQTVSINKAFCHSKVLHSQISFYQWCSYILSLIKQMKKYIFSRESFSL